MKLRNSWEVLPHKTGKIFIETHCGVRKIYLFEEENAKWTDIDQCREVCPKCEVFRWIDMEEE